MAENKDLFVKIAITSPAKTKYTTHFFPSAIILSLQRQGELKKRDVKKIYGRYEVLSTSAEKKKSFKKMTFLLTITFFLLKIDKHVLKRYFSTEIF